MNKEEFIKKIEDFCLSCKSNYVSEEDAIYPSQVGLRLYDVPLIGFALADDKLFTEEFKKKVSFILTTRIRKNGFRKQRRSYLFSFLLLKRSENLIKK